MAAAAAAALVALLLAMMNGYLSEASYCVCKDGVNEKMLQLNIDYACGNGGDCTAIHSGGKCYQPDNVKAHCDYAVNSYYQKKGQQGANCSFGGTATLTNSLPTTVSSGCSYPASASQVGGGTSTSTSTTGGSSSSSSSSSSSTYAPGPSGMDSSYNNASAADDDLQSRFSILILFSALIVGMWV